MNYRCTSTYIVFCMHGRPHSWCIRTISREI